MKKDLEVECSNKEENQIYLSLNLKNDIRKLAGELDDKD